MHWLAILVLLCSVAVPQSDMRAQGAPSTKWVLLATQEIAPGSASATVQVPLEQGRTSAVRLVLTEGILQTTRNGRILKVPNDPCLEGGDLFGERHTFKFGGTDHVSIHGKHPTGGLRQSCQEPSRAHRMMDRSTVE